ncbi:MAG: tagaturonate reductase [Eubacteriales bacterium]|nr:tagaturonate reductase [Eubacteriales bacterium]
MADTPLRERILQIGEGRFLRGFAGRIADELNRCGADIGITVVKPRTGAGIIPALNAGGGYRLHIRGLADGAVVNQTREIGCVLRGLNLIDDYEATEQAMLSRDLAVVISNTTEAGIVYREGAVTYPYMLAKLLYARFSASLRLPVVLPCELIEHNGHILRECVMKYASDQNMDSAFLRALESADFPDTLVDSIVTSGDDDTAVCAEPYYLWVIEHTPPDTVKKLIEKSGVNILFTDDILPWRRRKIAILNGAHTMSVMAGLLCGIETVSEMMSDTLFAEYIRRGVFDEIIPTLTLPRDQTESFARDVAERFRNPFVRHKLKDIALNSVSKARERIIPTLLRYTELYGTPPGLLTMSISALIAWYRSGGANDADDILAAFTHSSTAEILGNEGLWGADLGFLHDTIQTDLTCIAECGMRTALKKRCGL